MPQDKVLTIENCRVTMHPLKRMAMYGERKVVPLDDADTECRKGYVDEDGLSIFPSSATSVCRMTSEGTLYENRAQENAEKEARNGRIAGFEIRHRGYQREFCSFSENISLTRVTAETFDIDCFLFADRLMYTLEGFDQKALAERLGTGLFTFSFCDRYGGTIKPACIFARNGTVFLTIGNSMAQNHGFLSLENRLLTENERAGMELDDIDFDM